MRKLSMLFFIALLSSAMAVAQASSSSSAGQSSAGTQAQTQRAPRNHGQASSDAQTPMTVPRSGADQNASPANQGTSNNPDAQNGNANAAGTNQNGTAANTQQTPGATPGATQRTAGNSGGVPWGWIIIGIIVIAIILALIGRGGTDRVERRETIERDRTLGPQAVPPERRDDDNIRRVG